MANISRKTKQDSNQYLNPSVFEEEYYCPATSFKNNDELLNAEVIVIEEIIHKTQLPYNFNVHKEKDTKDQPYQFEIWEKRFTHSSNVKKHNQIHGKERSYRRDTCGKTFNWENNLRVHERIHMGERPYKCGLCNRQDRKTKKFSRPRHESLKLYQCCENMWSPPTPSSKASPSSPFKLVNETIIYSFRDGTFQLQAGLFQEQVCIHQISSGKKRPQHIGDKNAAPSTSTTITFCREAWDKFVAGLETILWWGGFDADVCLEFSSYRLQAEDMRVKLTDDTKCFALTEQTVREMIAQKGRVKDLLRILSNLNMHVVYNFIERAAKFLLRPHVVRLPTLLEVNNLLDSVLLTTTELMCLKECVKEKVRKEGRNSFKPYFTKTTFICHAKPKSITSLFSV